MYYKEERMASGKYDIPKHHAERVASTSSAAENNANLDHIGSWLLENRSMPRLILTMATWQHGCRVGLFLTGSFR